MTISSSPKAIPGPFVWWRSLAMQAVLGFLFGYVILHPASMVIFQCLDPRMADAMPDEMAGGFFAPIAQSFTLAHLPMALVFSIMAAVIAALYGYHRLAISFQRDRLAEELAHNEKLRTDLAAQAERLAQKNEELARLELANRRTTQFMAHDFKTALGCIAGFSKELFEMPELQQKPKVANALACIRRQAHRVIGSVSDLLQLARVRETGPPRMESVSVAGLLEEALSDFSLPAEAKQVSLGEQHTRCPPVLANRSLLRRVLCNLVSNAIKHNKPGTRVWLDAQVHPSGRAVVFSCRDDGAGVPPELLPSLFHEFTTNGDCSGGLTGLGLAFCKAAVEAHRGRIACKNLRQGVQFLFAIPIAQGVSQ